MKTHLGGHPEKSQTPIEHIKSDQLHLNRHNFGVLTQDQSDNMHMSIFILRHAINCTISLFVPGRAGPSGGIRDIHYPL